MEGWEGGIREVSETLLCMRPFKTDPSAAHLCNYFCLAARFVGSICFFAQLACFVCLFVGQTVKHILKDFN